MYLILGKNDNYVPIFQIKAVTPVSDTESKVTLNTGEVFMKEGTPVEILNSVTNMPQDYTFVVNSFAEVVNNVVTSTERSLRNISQDLADFKSEVRNKHIGVNNDLEIIGQKYDNARSQVDTSVKELNDIIKELKSTDLLFNSSKSKLDTTLKGLEELLSSEMDSLNTQEQL